SRARPKIADYPFTTLHPQLGVVGFRDREFVLADIPGLIEGAHEGTGLGDRFLGHLERCGVLLHLVDGSQEDVAGAYRTVRQELEAYAQGLAEKTEVVALNKVDLLTAEAQDARQAALAEASGRPVLLCAGATGEGVDAILGALVAHLPPPRDELPEAARAAYQP
ncbi:MAG: 50S ribosome-binding GTPase, partial [Kiloniellales bacterium]|nr:50S ribosome-binding GTPase [Kiloniellales bacterium]